MNLKNADYHALAHDVRAYYVFLCLEKRRLRRSLKRVEETILEMEFRHKIKREMPC